MLSSKGWASKDDPSTPPSPPSQDDKAAHTAEIVAALRRLFKAVQVHSKATLRATGLSGPQVWALTLLQADPGLSLGELARRMYAHPSTVSGVIARLVRRGAVRRVTDPLDRRGVRLSLTPTGRRLLRRCPPPVQVAISRALLRMPATRLRQINDALASIVLEAEVADLEAPLCPVAP
jgi:DNA-binding MarR family transcriptional regulator